VFKNLNSVNHNYWNIEAVSKAEIGIVIDVDLFESKNVVVGERVSDD